MKYVMIQPQKQERFKTTKKWGKRILGIYIVWVILDFIMTMGSAQATTAYLTKLDNPYMCTGSYSIAGLTELTTLNITDTLYATRTEFVNETVTYINTTGDMEINGALDIHKPATGDSFEILDPNGKECWALRSNNQMIVNANGDCAGASTTGNMLRMYQPDAGFTGNYILMETNNGVDVLRFDYQGHIFWSGVKIYGSSTSLVVKPISAGTGGSIGVFNGDGAGATFVSVDKGTFTEFEMVPGASKHISMFGASTSGETKDFRIYGYRAGDQLRSLNISVGETTDNTADFQGVSYYRFEGNLNITGNLNVTGCIKYNGGVLGTCI